MIRALKTSLLSLIFLAITSVVYGQSAVDLPPTFTLDFGGKLTNYGSGLFLNDNDFVNLENLEYYEGGGLGTRKGMTDYTSDFEPFGNEINKIIYFPHENEEYLIAVSQDSSSFRRYFSIEDQSFLSPYENFNPYTEVDDDSCITVSGTTVTIDGMPRDNNNYLYYDYGLDRIDGDFEYNFKFKFTEPGTTASGEGDLSTNALWNITFANALEDRQGLIGAGETITTIQFLEGLDGGVTSWSVAIYQYDNGSLKEADASSYQTDFSGTYFVTISRDIDSGTSSAGKYDVHFRTGSYSGSTIFSLSINTSNQDKYRYFYPVQNLDSGAAGAKAFGSLWDLSSPIHVSSGVTTTMISNAIVRDTLAVADEDGIFLWSGNSVFPTGLFAEYKDGEFTNVWDWVHSGESEWVDSGLTVHVGYSRPFDRWQSDQNKSMDHMASSVTPAFKAGLQQYWLTYVTTSGGSFFQYPKIETSFRELGTLGDFRNWQYPAGFIFQKTGTSEYQDFTKDVQDSSEETYADIGGMESGGTIAICFIYKPSVIKIEMPEQFKNETENIHLTMRYSDSSGSWVNAGTTTDGTRYNSAVFAQGGYLEFDPPSNWEMIGGYGEKDVNGFWMVLGIQGDSSDSVAIDDYVRIFKITAIPDYDSPSSDRHYTYIAEINNRLILANGDDESMYEISAYNQPDVFVGPDAISEFSDFHIGKREPTVAIAPMGDGAIIYKKTENYYLEFINPSVYEIKQLKNTRPCISSEGVVPNTYEETTLLGKTRKSFQIYPSSDGFYTIDAAGSNQKVDRGIEAYFEKGNAKQIPAAWLSYIQGWHDKVNNQVIYNVASGSGATQFNTQLVFDLDHGKWTTFSRDNNREISSGMFFTDIDNDRYQLAGGYDGYVYELDKGTDDDGYDIISDLTFKTFKYALGKGGWAGRSELRAFGLDYELIDDTSISGASLYVTPGLSSTETTYQTDLSLTDDGWVFTNIDGGDLARKGFAHKLRLRVPGRLYLYRHHHWVRPAPWAR